MYDEPARTPGVRNLAPRGLVILVNFLDVHFRDINTVADMDSMLNGHNYKYHKSYGSAKRYFEDQSLGQYSPVFDVVGPIQLPDSLSYYGRNLSNRRGADAKAPDMVLKACSIASQLPGVDLSLYDTDNNGDLDIVYVIYAGYGESDSHIDNYI
jgi:M6 family metalloprotease-like protein